MKTFRLFLVFTLLGFVARAAAPDPATRLAAARQLADGLKYQQGDITLHGGLAQLALPAKYRYLDSASTETLLTKIWGNPHGGGTLGMITPADFDPLADDQWAIVISFTEDGYVNDADAAKINYDDLMKQMKDGTREASKEREKQGFPAIELVGWAAPPRYDAVAHKLYWAKELKFAAAPEHTLNYNIRMLGRRGVLVLNAVGSMAQLKPIEAAAPAVLAMVNFQEGHRYADFKPDTDKVAAYGLAALVAGGIAAKAGLLKGLWVALLAAKKFVIIALIAIAGFLKRFFTGRSAKSEAAALRSDSTPPAA